VTRASVDGVAVRWQQRGAKVQVSAPAPIADGRTFAVELVYAGQPRPASSTWGPVGWEELTDGVLTANQPSGAPSWFPCNDLPAHKAPFRIAVTAASGYHVVANGALTSKRNTAGRTTWVYEQKEPMAPYLAVVHIGRYVEVDLGRAPVPVRAAVPRTHAARVRSAFSKQAQMVEVFTRLFGPYPYAAGYGLVVTDDPLEIPLEGAGLATFGSNHLDGSWERLIAHELAHQWFGNSVTAAEWRHIWLHEGFACYAEWIWSEAAGRETAATQARRHHRLLAGLAQDLVLGDPGPADMFDDRVYKRGALTLDAVRRAIGDAAFWRLLQTWASDHRHSAVTTADFVSHAERVAGRSLGHVFDPWLWNPTLPPLP
jgi:aminopeptidase N